MRTYRDRGEFRGSISRYAVLCILNVILTYEFTAGSHVIYGRIGCISIDTACAGEPTIYVRDNNVVLDLNKIALQCGGGMAIPSPTNSSAHLYSQTNFPFNAIQFALALEAAANATDVLDFSSGAQDGYKIDTCAYDQSNGVVFKGSAYSPCWEVAVALEAVLDAFEQGNIVDCDITTPTTTLTTTPSTTQTSPNPTSPSSTATSTATTASTKLKGTLTCKTVPHPTLSNLQSYVLWAGGNDRACQLQAEALSNIIQKCPDFQSVEYTCSQTEPLTIKVLNSKNKGSDQLMLAASTLNNVTQVWSWGEIQGTAKSGMLGVQFDGISWENEQACQNQAATLSDLISSYSSETNSWIDNGGCIIDITTATSTPSTTATTSDTTSVTSTLTSSLTSSITSSATTTATTTLTTSATSSGTTSATSTVTTSTTVTTSVTSTVTTSATTSVTTTATTSMTTSVTTSLTSTATTSITTSGTTSVTSTATTSATLSGTTTVTSTVTTSATTSVTTSATSTVTTSLTSSGTSTVTTSITTSTSATSSITSTGTTTQTTSRTSTHTSSPTTSETSTPTTSISSTVTTSITTSATSSLTSTHSTSPTTSLSTSETTTLTTSITSTATSSQTTSVTTSATTTFTSSITSSLTSTVTTSASATVTSSLTSSRTSTLTSSATTSASSTATSTFTSSSTTTLSTTVTTTATSNLQGRLFCYEFPDVSNGTNPSDTEVFGMWSGSNNTEECKRQAEALTRIAQACTEFQSVEFTCQEGSRLPYLLAALGDKKKKILGQRALNDMTEQWSWGKVEGSAKLNYDFWRNLYWSQAQNSSACHDQAATLSSLISAYSSGTDPWLDNGGCITNITTATTSVTSTPTTSSTSSPTSSLTSTATTSTSPTSTATSTVTTSTSPTTTATSTVTTSTSPTSTATSTVTTSTSPSSTVTSTVTTSKTSTATSTVTTSTSPSSTVTSTVTTSTSPSSTVTSTVTTSTSPSSTVTSTVTTSKTSTVTSTVTTSTSPSSTVTSTVTTSTSPSSTVTSTVTTSTSPSLTVTSTITTSTSPTSTVTSTMSTSPSSLTSTATLTATTSTSTLSDQVLISTWENFNCTLVNSESEAKLLIGLVTEQILLASDFVLRPKDFISQLSCSQTDGNDAGDLVISFFLLDGAVITAYNLLLMVEPNWLYLYSLPATSIIAKPMPSLSDENNRDVTIAVISVLFASVVIGTVVVTARLLRRRSFFDSGSSSGSTSVKSGEYMVNDSTTDVRPPAVEDAWVKIPENNADNTWDNLTLSV